MFAFAFLLTVMCMYFEYYIVAHNAMVRRLLKHPKGSLISLGFSLLISIVVGSLFGAAGMIVMFAGMTSTVLMQPIYALMRAGKWDPTISGAKVIARCILYPFFIVGRLVGAASRFASKFDRSAS